MELPYCKNWLEQLLAEGHTALQLAVRLARAGFTVNYCSSYELSPPGLPDVVCRAYVGYGSGMNHVERYCRLDQELGGGETVEELHLAAIETAAYGLFFNFSYTCEMCANAEHGEE